MNQMDGGVTVDRGYRGASAGSSSGGGGSRVEERAAATRSVSLGSGVYGAEDWVLPGFGESGPRCGDYYPEAVCETCGEPEFGTHQCGRRECPECWGSWAKEAAVKRAVRLQARRLQEPDNYQRQAAHGLVSPNEEIQTIRQFKNWRSKAGEIAQEHGFRGCDVVGHPFRTTDEADQLYERADPDVGKWVWLRENHPERLTLAHADPLVVWSPHYHIIGLTSADMEEGDGEEYVYQFFDSLDALSGKYDRDAHGNVYGVYRYLLSHAGFHREEGHNTVVGYGDLSNARFHEFQPSDREMEVLEREVREAVGAPDEEGEEAADDEVEECPQEACEGQLIDVWDIRSYLEQMEPPPEIEAAMMAAYEWRMGDVEPPPGLKRPGSREEAREAFEALL
jgi:hypothetical protein